MLEPRRLVILITDSGIGGTEKVISTLLQTMDRSRFIPVGVAVLKQTRESAKVWSSFNVPVISFGMKKYPTPHLVAAVSKQFEEWKADVVHAFLFHSIQVARLIKLRGATWKLVSSPRVNYAFAPKFALWVDRFLKRCDDAVLCESEASRRYLVQSLNYNPKTAFVAPNGVDGSIYVRRADARNRIRAELGIGDEDVLVGSVGRLHSQKGYDLLVAALEKIKRSPVAHQTILLGEGPERASLEEQIRRAGVSVRLIGQRRDVADVLSALDIYIQSSRYEGLSNALLEAMSSSCACVATAVDGTLDFARDGENMLLVRPDDVDSLALGIATLLEKPTLRATLAQNATITTRQFTLEKMVRNIETTYETVLASPS